jgi:hypothetical protein
MTVIPPGSCFGFHPQGRAWVSEAQSGKNRKPFGTRMRMRSRVGKRHELRDQQGQQRPGTFRRQRHIYPSHRISWWGAPCAAPSNLRLLAPAPSAGQGFPRARFARGWAPSSPYGAPSPPKGSGPVVQLRWFAETSRAPPATRPAQLA